MTGGRDFIKTAAATSLYSYRWVAGIGRNDYCEFWKPDVMDLYRGRPP